MPELPKPRHEQFAIHLAAGMPDLKAYVAAGYKSSRPACSRLRNDVNILRRVEELHQPAAEIVAEMVFDRIDVTIEMVLAGLYKEANRVDDSATHSARVAAWGHISKHLAEMAKIAAMAPPAEKPDLEAANDSSRAHKLSGFAKHRKSG